VSAAGRAASDGRERGTARERPNELVALVTRLVFAQAAVAGAIGFSYSRRSVPWLVATVMLAIALCGLAVMARSGSHAAWLFAVGVEAVLAAFGLLRFVTARYLGGTLFGLVTLGVLVHPAVVRAFGGLPWPRGQRLDETSLDDLTEGVGDGLGDRAAR
jgi:uncharacterized membrane protein (UPF0136 family)